MILKKPSEFSNNKYSTMYTILMKPIICFIKIIAQFLILILIFNILNIEQHIEKINDKTLFVDYK